MLPVGLGIVPVGFCTVMVLPITVTVKATACPYTGTDGLEVSEYETRPGLTTWFSGLDTLSQLLKLESPVMVAVTWWVPTIRAL